jgi:hypothetical protein
VKISAVILGAFVGGAGLAYTSPNADATLLTQYQFGTTGQETTSETSPAYSATIVAPGVAASSITDPMGTVGLEISSATTTPANAPFLRLDPQGNSADPNAALTNNKFFQFVISATTGADVDLSSLTLNVARGGGGTPRGFFVETSADNFATALPATGSPAFTANAVNPIGNDVNTVRPNYSVATVDLSGASFQNIQNLIGSALTVRIYAYSPAAGSSVDFDDITVNGTATVPEPGTIGLLMLGGVPLLLRRRRPA